MKLLATLIATAAVTTGCGKFSGKSDDSSGVPDVKDMNLVGTWERNCEKSDLVGLQYRKVKLVMGPLKSYTREQTFFNDKGCNGERYVEKQTGTWNVIGSTAADAGVKEINFTVKEASVNPRNDTVVKEFNLLKYCGINNWQNGQDSKVTNVKCTSGFNDGQVIPEITRMEDKNLFFGKTGLFLTGNTSGSRPDTLDRDRPYSKK